MPRGDDLASREDFYATARANISRAVQNAMTPRARRLAEREQGVFGQQEERTTTLRAATGVGLVLTALSCSSGPPLSNGELIFQGEPNQLQILSSSLPIVIGTIDDNVESPFLFDSGSTCSSITSDLASLCDLEGRRIKQTRVQLPDSAITVAKVFRPREVSFGSVTLRSADLLAQELPLELGGLIGANIIRRTAVILDGAQHVIALVNSPINDYLAKNYPGRTWTSTPLETRGGLPVIAVVSGGAVLRMIVDSGSTTTSLSQAAIDRLCLTPDGETTSLVHDGDREEVVVTKCYRTELAFGRWHIELETDTMPDQNVNDLGLDGTIGYDVLGRIPCAFGASLDRVLIADPVGESRLSIIGSSGALSAFRDEYAPIRSFAARGVLASGELKYVPEVAALLSDKEIEVRAIAASVLREIAGERWPQASLVVDAEEWWESHKEDPRFREE